MSCCFRKPSSSKSSKGTAAAPPAASSAAAVPPSTSPVLQRILTCQSGRWHDVNSRCPSFEDALDEIKAGHKSSHWMWYIWPSLVGIRTTQRPELMILNLQCAVEYLNHPKLGPRLLAISLAAHAHLRSGMSPSTLFGPMAKVDSEKFHEVMTCFCIAAQSSGAADAGAVFEKCMYSIASALPGARDGMHMPTVQLLQQQQSSFAVPAPAAALSTPVHNAQDNARAPPDNVRVPGAVVLDSAARGGGAVATGREQIGIADAAAIGAVHRISPSSFPHYKGFDSKRVREELQKKFPHALIEILKEGDKLHGTRTDRIVIVVDKMGEVVAAPRVG